MEYNSDIVQAVLLGVVYLVVWVLAFGLALEYNRYRE
jgi:hypothetical protein